VNEGITGVMTFSLTCTYFQQ